MLQVKVIGRELKLLSTPLLTSHSRVTEILILRPIQMAHVNSTLLPLEIGKNSTLFLKKTVCSLFKAFTANILPLKMISLSAIEIILETGKNSDGTTEIEIKIHI